MELVKKDEEIFKPKNLFFACLLIKAVFINNNNNRKVFICGRK